MTAFAMVLLAAALSLPAPYGASEDRPERIATIATALDQEARSDGVWPREAYAYLALVTMWNESRRFAKDVHTGARRGDRGKSVCLGQIKGGGSELAGTDLAATRRCVAEVLRHLQYHRKRCKVNAVTRLGAAKISVGYGTGWSCDPHFVHVISKREFGWNRSGQWARFWWRR